MNNYKKNSIENHHNQYTYTTFWNEK